MKKYNHNLYMLKLTLKNMWPLCWKETARKDREAWYKGERALHHKKLEEINRQVAILLPALIKAKVERSYKGQYMLVTSMISPEMVKQITMMGSVDKQVWEYLAEQMGYQLARELKTMNFNSIKVIE